MISFIEEVLIDLEQNNQSLPQTVFIVPSKRAGVFIKSLLKSRSEKTFFAPEILSIEDFVTELSSLKLLSNSEVLFKFYETYISSTPKDLQEPFESFSKWAQTVLQDFNEIDRFLISENKIFDYLNAIQELKHWSLEKNHTDLTKRYLNFWNKLKDYYLKFTSSLKKAGAGYQGLIYREAVNNLEAYIGTTNLQHVFIGFNALNKAEEQIIQGLLQSDLAKIYWDIDSSFINNKNHDAGFFIRQYQNKWPYFKTHKFNWETKHYAKEKFIEIIGCPKQIGQAKYAGHLLSQLSINNPNLKNTALVLGDETFLLPVLNALPKSVLTANVTMGLPLKSVPFSSLFDRLLTLHKKAPTSFYYKDVLEIINHPMISILLVSSENIKSNIQTQNAAHISLNGLIDSSPENEALLSLIFGDWQNDVNKAIQYSIELIYKIKEFLSRDSQSSKLELEYLYKFYTIFNELSTLNSTYPYLKNISDLHSLFKDLLVSERLDFKGEPLEGLQIMGMLESRVLDFDTVILTSVNEGVLPAGKSNNSFIPFDIKIENSLPTYKEKDAVYTYHFYHLLNRAKTIYILYNTEVDALNAGEKSRFITQLEIEGVHKIKYKIASPSIPIIDKKLITVKKEGAIISKLKSISEKGFSPSSLTNYMRNPIDFYHQKILGIKEVDEVEETVAANTLGSVIHNTLEDLYRPLVNEYLSSEALLRMKPQIDELVSFHFKTIYKSNSIKKGKNLIIYEIAKRYVLNFINSELEQINNGDQIKILGVELDCTVNIPIKELDYVVNLTGKLDRIDEFNGMTRIIDYKSGKVEQNKVEIVDWKDITTDYEKYSKSFQILCYAYMIHRKNIVSLPIEAGIISFKNLSGGFLKFGKKESSNSRKKDQQITEEVLINFEAELKSLILEIFNPNIDFTEKELK